MAMSKVVFLPDQKNVEAEKETTIMEAAQKAGVYINSLCGGNGVCGRCKVQVSGGRVLADKDSISLLSKDEIKEGYVLACQASIDHDVEVVIPPESRLEEEQILMGEGVMDYSKPERLLVPKVPADPLTFFEPISQKIYLEIQPPAAGDNISDADRIIRELRKKTDYQDFKIPLHCLQGMAMKLRDNGWKVTATISRNNNSWLISQIEAGDTYDRNYGLSIDIGTTTVVAQLVNMDTGDVEGVAGSHNLQAHYGEDVISRMIFACGVEQGLDPLHRAIIKNINNLIEILTGKKGIDKEQITAIVAAGNTTMSHLFLSLTPCSIRLDPYVPTASSFPHVEAGQLGININSNGILETIPAVASYVGGDIVAGVIACGIADHTETKALIDVGTNGEIVIGNNDWRVCCSASAGPAFEGGGIRNGMRATRGAIERIKIEDNKLIYRTIGGDMSQRKCGFGLIDCIYAFVTNGIIDNDGKFKTSSMNKRIIEKDGERQFIVVYSQDTETGKDLTKK